MSVKCGRSAEHVQSLRRSTFQMSLRTPVWRGRRALSWTGMRRGPAYLPATTMRQPAGPMMQRSVSYF